MAVQSTGRVAVAAAARAGRRIGCTLVVDGTWSEVSTFVGSGQAIHTGVHVTAMAAAATAGTVVFTLAIVVDAERFDTARAEGRVAVKGLAKHIFIAHLCPTHALSAVRVFGVGVSAGGTNPTDARFFGRAGSSVGLE